MAMNELKQLVRRWLAGDLDYAQFRREFVQRFQGVENADEAVEVAANAIESDCSDYSENLIDVDTLKQRVALDVQRRLITAQNAQIVISVVDFDRTIAVEDRQGRIAFPAAASGTASSESKNNDPGTWQSDVSETRLTFAAEP
jgi:hypothetical protein